MYQKKKKIYFFILLKTNDVNKPENTHTTSGNLLGHKIPWIL